MNDGTFSIRRRHPKASEEASSASHAPRKDPLQALLDGDNLPPPRTPASSSTGPKKRRPTKGDENELKIESKRRKKLRDYDRLLKSFKYSAALDAVLKKVRICLSSFAALSRFFHPSD